MNGKWYNCSSQTYCLEQDNTYCKKDTEKKQTKITKKFGGLKKSKFQNVQFKMERKMTLHQEFDIHVHSGCEISYLIL